MDHELGPLSRFLQPIEEDYGYGIGRTRRLDLPKVFLGAEACFGRTSERFDPDKGSFRFPLWLSGRRGELELQYLVLLRDVRGSIEAPFFRLQKKRCDERVRGYQPPVSSELSRDDLNYLTDYLIGYLGAKGEALAGTALPFVRAVRDERLVYGCRAGDLFERRLDSEEMYRRVLERAAREVDVQRQERGYVDELLEDFSRGQIRVG